jgi:hypothetical protein
LGPILGSDSWVRISQIPTEMPHCRQRCTPQEAAEAVLPRPSSVSVGYWPPISSFKYRNCWAKYQVPRLLSNQARAVVGASAWRFQVKHVSGLWKSSALGPSVLKSNTGSSRGHLGRAQVRGHLARGMRRKLVMSVSVRRSLQPGLPDRREAYDLTPIRR